ncbi:hypothetical protein EDC56_3552 [Sinobacterium caligoides]|uniref:Uncharacterized protein n=1 Tax=Sinobacterium caligoides TaxID=933926 RepID=A0A3N2DDL2_9GAMM|nr:hypothetical protein [Sinobacterium caligoides]ROR97885.1 hypothetical protein EDC56_3552 [Sinobacterium caligoides]
MDLLHNRKKCTKPSYNKAKQHRQQSRWNLYAQPLLPALCNRNPENLMRRYIFIIFILSLLQACVSTSDVVSDKFKAGEHAQQAEKERRQGDEGAAIIHENLSRHYEERSDRAMDDLSFFDIILSIIFD